MNSITDKLLSLGLTCLNDAFDLLQTSETISELIVVLSHLYGSKMHCV